jgi:hypothetical protein
MPAKCQYAQRSLLRCHSFEYSFDMPLATSRQMQPTAAVTKLSLQQPYWYWYLIGRISKQVVLLLKPQLVHHPLDADKNTHS